MRAAIYARYSSDLQRPASIDDQVRKCREVIEARGWQEVGVFEDREVPGSVSLARPGYQQMLSALKERQFDVLIADELSRLTRDAEHQAHLRKQLRFHRVGLIAVGDGLDTVTSPAAAGFIMLAKSFVNEAELEANAHRSRRGLEGRVRAGFHAGGALYGYRTRPVHADGPGEPTGTGPVIGYEYVIHEGEAEVIRRIFQMYVDGMGARRIADTLNAEGVVPPAYKWRNRKGVRRSWSCSAVSGDSERGTGILNNEKYIGRLIWNRSRWPRDPERDGRKVRRERPREEWVVVDAPELRIVPQELWDAVKARQEQRSRRHGNAGAFKRNQRLLSGLLICGKCGAGMVLRGRNSYGCSARQNRGLAVCDSLVTVNAPEAEDTVLGMLREVIYSEDRLRALTDAVNKRLRAATERRAHERRRVAEVRSELAEVEGEISRLVDGVAQGALVDDLRERMRQAEVRRERLREELAAAETEATSWLQVIPGAVRAIVDDLGRMLREGQVERVKSALSRLVEKIEVHEEPRPERKRPAAKLIFRANLLEAVRLALQKVKTSGSPGGIRTRDLVAENHVS